MKKEIRYFVPDDYLANPFVHILGGRVDPWVGCQLWDCDVTYKNENIVCVFFKR